ncbi:MAG TPA: hypothetical protein VF040_16505, partial [Ktedonobacterales bacterium]
RERQYLTPTASLVEAFTTRLEEIAEESANLARSVARMQAAGQRGAHYLEAELSRLSDEEHEVRRRLAVAEMHHADWRQARDLLATLLAGGNPDATTVADKRLALRALGVTVTMQRRGGPGHTTKRPRAAGQWTLTVAPFSAPRPPVRLRAVASAGIDASVMSATPSATTPATAVTPAGERTAETGDREFFGAHPLPPVEKNSTIIFPLPIDLIEPLRELLTVSARHNSSNGNPVAPGAPSPVGAGQPAMRSTGTPHVSHPPASEPPMRPQPPVMPPQPPTIPPGTIDPTTPH